MMQELIARCVAGSSSGDIVGGPTARLGDRESVGNLHRFHQL